MLWAKIRPKEHEKMTSKRSPEPSTFLNYDHDRQIRETITASNGDDFEIVTNRETVWVNDLAGNCHCRFGANGWEFLMVAKEFHAVSDLTAWTNFVTAVKSRLFVDINCWHMPIRLR